MRFDNPVEKEKKDSIKNDKIRDIGKGLKLSETNGEFIGMFKLSKKVSLKIKDQYKKIKKTQKTNRLQIHDFFRN